MAVTKLHSNASSHKRTLRAGPLRNNVSNEYELQLVCSNRAVVMTDIVEKIDLLPLKIGLVSSCLCGTELFGCLVCIVRWSYFFFLFCRHSLV